MSSLRQIGTRVAADLLGPLTPEDILDELDRPMLFTARAGEGDRLLVCFLDAEDAGDVRLVVPTRDSIVAELRAGKLTLRDALWQPWAWLQFHDELRAVAVDALPSDCLPLAGTYLEPEHQPVVSIRLLGDFDDRNVVASIINRAAESVRKSLKVLIDYVTETSADGRPYDSQRRLYDLPAKRLAYGSFEVDFGEPAQAGLLPEEADILIRASELLNEGLDWALKPSGAAPQDEKWNAILSALRYLVPPATGVVKDVELAGKMTARRVHLNRNATRNVFQALKVRSGEMLVVSYVGRIREWDKDRLSFILRSADTAEQKCFFGDELSEEVEIAFDDETLVRVVGLQDVRATRTDVLLIHREGEAPAQGT